MIGVAIGVSLMVIGVSIARTGIGQPAVVSGVTTQEGVASDNLPEITSLLLTVAGVSTFGGSIIYGVRTWKAPIPICQRTSFPFEHMNRSLTFGRTRNVMEIIIYVVRV